MSTPVSITHEALEAGLVSKVEITRQVGTTLYFKAHGSAPGQPRITYEENDLAAAVIQVLTKLATLSPKKSPRGDEAIALLGDHGYEAPEREKDPEPKTPAKPAAKGEAPSA